MLPKIRSTLCVLQSSLQLLPRLVSFKTKNRIALDRFAVSLTSATPENFGTITGEETAVSESEKEKCRAWFDAHIRSADDPAFDFSVGGRSFGKHPGDWEIEVGDESETGAVERGGKTTVLTLKHRLSAITARVEATIFEENASCSWTIFIKNEGESPSPVVGKFFAADFRLESERTKLFFSRGSDSKADDFELVESAVNFTPMTLGAAGGRNSSFLPFFNLSGSEGGAVLAVGWTGQWSASFQKASGGVKIRAKQENFRAPLEAGEEVRSPMISLTFFDGKNALKGFESFRRFQLDCLFPKELKPMRGFMLANEFCTLDCGGLIEKAEETGKAVPGSIDYFWMDAGWYKYGKNWYDGVGNWTPDEKRFPETIRPLSDAIAEKGIRFLLWYEPERIREGTNLAAEGAKHRDRTIRIGSNIMWNMADGDACAFLSDHIAASLLENGVSVFRQDFNFDPLIYWEKADRELYGGRKGICENRYVTNLYRFLDTLAERVDGLMIDNCASGGRRIDIEMCRRSVPLWRSDYNCVPADGSKKADVHEATQAMTFGLSFWLPMSGTMQHFESKYAARSAILTHPLITGTENFESFDRVRKEMTKNFFPLSGGGTDSGKTLAMQFGNAESGSALVFIRENSPETFVLRLNGLSGEKTYLLSDEDDPGFSVQKNGKELMKEGVTLKSETKPFAFVIYYEVEKK